MVFSLFRKKDGSPASTGPATQQQQPTTTIARQLDPSPTPATPKPVEGPAAESYNLSELSIEVEEAASHLSAAEEEAVVLHANGQIALATKALTSHLPTISGQRRTESWLMLFELYQQAGDRKAFDDLALAYVLEFEISPPLWRGVPVQESAPAQGGSYVALPAQLNANSFERELDRLIDACKPGNTVRLDFSKVTEIDPFAAAELLSLWPRTRKQGAILQVLGASEIVALLSGKIETGRRLPAEAPFWLLLIELMQATGDAERFDEVAIDYAITFEVSPPSWDDKLVPKQPVAKAPAVPAAQAPTPSPTSPDRLIISGVLVDGAPQAMAQMRDFIRQHGKPVLDFSAVTRVDFETGGQLLNLTMETLARGQTVTYSRVNELVLGLMRLMGIADLVSVGRQS
ncbi:STAS domain-containing protein [Jeongeupia naejangsanensis]|uniref:STAS domain-containing protein n=1 Tax=Jeongeupia naejangsanensis TaxID=613195 RepID=A0ABS2BRA0_9NEIS|nr:STAS domain-containing protein [Jeongeupia naejangsanensis]MBM3117319.1 STAS domain-containing protein [Jeongeupia naejangsanensis]